MSEIRETVYDHEAGGKKFSVTANERWSINMVKRLATKYPDEVEITVTNADGSLIADFPASWMRIVPKRKIEMSDEKRAELCDRLQSYRNQKAGEGENEG